MSLGLLLPIDVGLVSGGGEGDCICYSALGLDLRGWLLLL